MSVPGLSEMRLLLDAAIVEVERWQASPTVAGIPSRRVLNFRDKLRALQGCGSVNLLQTGMAHVFGSLATLGISASELAPSLLKLALLLDERKVS